MRPNGICRTNFEAWVLTLMAEAGIETYADLAAQAGVDTSTIQRICSGVTEPSIGTLKKLAKVLGCSLNELVSMEYENTPKGGDQK